MPTFFKCLFLTTLSFVLIPLLNSQSVKHLLPKTGKLVNRGALTHQNYFNQ